jgi:hypothetical protein
MTDLQCLTIAESEAKNLMRKLYAASETIIQIANCLLEGRTGPKVCLFFASEEAIMSR